MSTCDPNDRLGKAARQVLVDTAETWRPTLLVDPDAEEKERFRQEIMAREDILPRH
jgi:hypothetical protein